MIKRQSLLPSMKELVRQLVEMADEGSDLTETRTNYENLVGQWNQLSERLTAWIAQLQVTEEVAFCHR